MIVIVHTVIKTPNFKRMAKWLWFEDERLAFIYRIAINPLAGDVIAGPMAQEIPLVLRQ